MRAQRRRMSDGRLHLQDGPIDLIIGCDGASSDIANAYDAAWSRFGFVLDELCAELPLLRSAVTSDLLQLRGAIARRMQAAVNAVSSGLFITPMAAVAGAVAEDILDAMTKAVPHVQRAFVNNGGDIALHLARDAHYSIGLIDRPDRPAMSGTATIDGRSDVRGIATSGWRGRSFSLGIADAVTVLAATASRADAAATVIANAVDLPGDPRIERMPAHARDPQSDLGERLVTVDVHPLADVDLKIALRRGQMCAQGLMQRGLIHSAALQLQGVMACVAPEPAHSHNHFDVLELTA